MRRSGWPGSAATCSVWWSASRAAGTSCASTSSTFCDFAVEVVTEAPRAAVAHAAATSDLLVVGRRRPVRTEGSRLGPVTAAVLEDLVCPVLLTTPGRTSRLGATPGPAALTHQM